MPARIANACCKNVLCQINANRRSIHIDFPFRHFRLKFNTPILAL